MDGAVCPFQFDNDPAVAFDSRGSVYVIYNAVPESPNQFDGATAVVSRGSARDRALVLPSALSRRAPARAECQRTCYMLRLTPKGYA